MKRLSLLAAVVLGFVGCTSEIDSDRTACYDTGDGIKCVPYNQVPSGTPLVCEDADQTTPPSEDSASSAEGPSPSDDATSVSSDTGLGGTGSTGASSSDTDASGVSESSSAPAGCGQTSSSDTDADGVPNGDDCDCVLPPGGTEPPPGGEPPPPVPPTGDGPL